MTAVELDEGSRTETAPAPHDPPERRDGITYEAIAVIAIAIAMVAVVLALVAMGLATRAIDEHRAIPAAGGGAAPVAVSLQEFSISPAPLAAPAGSSLSVSNAGSVVHDLAVDGLATPEIEPGGTATLDVSSLAPGTYSVYCRIPGHREAGMAAQLTIS